MLLLNHTCDIWRNESVGTNGRKQIQKLHEGVRCLAMPMGSAVAIQNDMKPGRAYDVHFAPDTDVKVGDKLDWMGTTVMVKYIRPYINTPPVSHLEAACEQEIS